jgi:hypothetical protein
MLLFFEDTRCIQPILNDTVDFHVQAVDYHRNLADIDIRQHPINVAGIRSAHIPVTILVVWPESGQNGWLAVQIWPEYPGQNDRI